MLPALLRLSKRPIVVSTLRFSTPASTDFWQDNVRCGYVKSQTTVAQHELCEEESHFSISRVHIAPQRLRVRDLATKPRSARIERRQETPKNLTATHTYSRLADLDFQSDIGHTKEIGTRIIDDPRGQIDFALWEELLRYRLRRYGNKGALDIWRGLTVRLRGVWLPVDGNRAEFFWWTFINVGFQRQLFLESLADYAQRLWEETGTRWGGFYETIVGGLLQRGLARQALRWHEKLRHPHLAHPNDIVRILIPSLSFAAHREGKGDQLKTRCERYTLSSGIWVFRSICQTVDGHQIYAPVISTFVRHGLTDDAVSMHTFLVDRNDHPQSMEELQPLLDSVKRYGTPTMMRRLQHYADHRFRHHAKLNYESEDPGQDLSLETVPDRSVHDKSLKDEFGARLFATKAFKFEMIVSGLRMFGIQAVGPATLREMALRAHGCQDLLTELGELQKAGISIGNSLFARLVRKLAAENREILLSDVLHSDQHPDAFEDSALQESLLVSFYIARDWRQYHMTMAILGELLSENTEMTNIHFRKFVVAREWAAALKTVDDLYLQGKSIDSKSIDFIFAHVLTPRRERSIPPQRQTLPLYDEVDFVFRILRRVALAGGHVPPSLWTELLKRLGMDDRWATFRDCCVWLARHYSPDHKQKAWISLLPDRTQHAVSRLPASYGNRVLRDIFNPRMQAAIVAWGFKTRNPRRLETIPEHDTGISCKQLIPCVRGLLLLRELEQQGVYLSLKWIRRTCRIHLAVLFSRHSSSRRRQNRALRRENPYKLEDVLHDINIACGQSFFTENEVLELHSSVSPSTFDGHLPGVTVNHDDETLEE